MTTNTEPDTNTAGGPTLSEAYLARSDSNAVSIIAEEEKENYEKPITANKKGEEIQLIDPNIAEKSIKDEFKPHDSTLPVSTGINAVANLLDNENKGKLQSLIKRQGSSSESVSCSLQYNGIPHMITTSTEAGKLPLFSSWALTQLGSSSVYAHSSGVNQPGMISGTRNLLPWDVPLKNTDWHTLQRKWPNIAESAIKKSSFNPKGKGADMGLTVKVFVGLEYECPRGHRIIASSPGKTKSMTSSITNRMVNSDAPLYTECQCTKGSSSTHPVISQLMRIHIVTPKAPMHITMNPRVIPCPDGPTFHPGWQSQHIISPKTGDEQSADTSNSIVKLPISTYWVLRLPFIYEGKPYL